MHVLVFGMNYAPEKTAIGPYTTGLAEYLVECGHQVTVATAFPHYPQWRVDEAYARRRRPFLREVVKGVEVRRGWVFIPQGRNVRQRVLYDSSLAATALANTLALSSVDLILCVSPPLQLALTAFLVGAIHRAPVVLLVKDLVPDVALSVGLMEEGKTVKLARKLERFVYGRSDSIILIGQALVDNLLAKGVSPDKLVLIPDWVDTAHVRPLPRENAFRESQHIESDRFLVLHAGNMGAKQGLETLIDAAEQLAAEQDVLFLLVGEGSEKAQLERHAADRQLLNVRFLPLQAIDTVPWMLAAADAVALVQRAEVLDAVVPSKLLTYMAAGRSVIVSANPASAAATTVAQVKCGIAVPPGDDEALAGAIYHLKQNPSDSSAMGQRGRTHAEDNYAREVVLDRYRGHLERMAAARAV